MTILGVDAARHAMLEWTKKNEGTMQKEITDEKIDEMAMGIDEMEVSMESSKRKKISPLKYFIFHVFLTF